MIFLLFLQFFKSLKPTVESYAKFLGGILRCHDADCREFSLTVERIVWDLIKFNYDDYTNKYNFRFTEKSLKFNTVKYTTTSVVEE